MQVRGAGVRHTLGLHKTLMTKLICAPSPLAPSFSLVHYPVLISAYCVSLFQMIICFFFCLTSLLEHMCSARSRIFLVCLPVSVVLRIVVGT